MQNILTQSDIRAYHQRGVKVITLPEVPLLTDCARDELKRLGMQLAVGDGAAPMCGAVSMPSAPATAAQSSGGGYGNAGAPDYSKPIRSPFRDVICSNKHLIGTFVGTPHPVMTEYLGHLGFDFLCIDAEHNAIHLAELQKMLQGLQASRVTYGMVRVPTLSYEYVSGALDIGADALLIPQIRTVDDIKRLREYSQYPPIGRRGAGPSRLWEYGDTIGTLADQQNRNRTTNIVVQLETVSAVENLDAILKEAADFVDMFFIGPGDLSMDMGIFGQNSNPKLVNAVMMMREKTRAAGKRLGIFAGNFQAAQGWYEKGFDMTIINSELALMGSAISRDMKSLRSAIGESLE